MKFTVFDIETANSFPTSICSIGLTIIEDFEIIDTFEYFVKPVPFTFDDKNIEIHGITAADVVDSPTFDVVWKDISKYFDNLNLCVAHNAQFDVMCLKATLEHYNLKYNNFPYICTLLYTRYFDDFEAHDYKLSTLCEMFGIENLGEHDAGFDSLATAQLLLNLIDLFNDNLCSLMDNGYAKSFYDFELSNKKTHRINSKDFKIRAKDIVQSNSETDTKNLLHNKHFVITGSLVSLTRQEAYQRIVDNGGIVSDNVTKSTNYLVTNSNNMTGKMKKAIEYKAKGQEIAIIDENTLIELLR